MEYKITDVISEENIAKIVHDVTTQLKAEMPEGNLKRYTKFKTAMLAREKGFILISECDSGFNPNDGTILRESWPWLCRYHPLECYGRPEQWLLQEWLRETFNIQIDIFYEAGGYSGRVFRLGDPERRWQSCSTKSYSETLENMLFMGLDLIDITVEPFNKEKAWAANIKEALEHHD